jgi:hypothetical protein
LRELFVLIFGKAAQEHNELGVLVLARFIFEFKREFLKIGGFLAQNLFQNTRRTLSHLRSQQILDRAIFVAVT